jgi:hypothetical protein
MKILRIHLHLFGGATDRFFDLSAGLNIIEGPNEFGKSTLNQALWHTLFTPTNLTPVALRKTMGRWFPRPSGDHASVSLDFEAQGQVWSLKKRWGIAASSSLGSSLSPAMADPGHVQERLLELLHRNEATWRHVLFVSQAQLTKTVEDLRENASQVEDLRPLLAGAAAIPGDITPERIVAAIDSRIEDHFSRWDQPMNGPERGRGIDNPWANKVGPQLAAYYALKITERDLDQVVSHEKKVDLINENIRQQERFVEADRQFVETGRPLRAGLAKRDGLEGKIKWLKSEQSTLRGIFMEWPGAVNKAESMNSRVQQGQEVISGLENELGNARRREKAADQQAGYVRVKNARHYLDQTIAFIATLKPIPSSILNELKSLSQREENLRVQIAAQKLSARLESKARVIVELTRGAGAKETVEVFPEVPWTGQIEGKLSVEFGDLKIEVASGTGELESLFGELEQIEVQHKGHLATLGVDDLQAAEAAHTLHKKAEADVTLAKQRFVDALQGRTEEEWHSEVAANEAIPQTRSVMALEAELKNALTTKAVLEAEKTAVEIKIRNWTGQYGDVDKLTSLVLKAAQDVVEAEMELKELPQVPDGFSDAGSYLSRLSSAETHLESVRATLGDLRIQQAASAGLTPQRSAEELQEELETKVKAFERVNEIGSALLRIKLKLDDVLALRGDDNPMQKVEAAVAARFRDLTCGAYDRIRMDAGAPVEVTGKVSLPTAMLSQGTLGSLALATRLCLAEWYLEGTGGFIVLDDPFTDMDPVRRKAAGQSLKDFAKSNQVIYLTCHPEHATELKEFA